jgi:murein DD-endopeptidase MepM/ murein hydrolase activator NlpD
MPGIAQTAGGFPDFGLRGPARARVHLLGAAALVVVGIAVTLAARGPAVAAASTTVPVEGPAPIPPAPIAAAAPAPIATPPAQSTPGPVRLTGLAGDNLNLAMTRAGVSAPMARDYLQALASRIRLADGISVADRFDLVVDRSPGRDGKPAERLLYAGLDRVGASDVMLMRWTTEGKGGWLDAQDTGGAAEAMRMPVAASVSSSFGMRVHPILGSHRFHRGVDLRAGFGTPIRASADGRVTFAGWNGGYGRQVMIDHGRGLASMYAHMSRMAARPGAMVHRGEVIGYVGSTGLSTGPHLHYEVLQNGKPVNPLATRFVGTPGLDRDQRTAFNARLRALLTGGRG